jgi:hypothetical protein
LLLLLIKVLIAVPIMWGRIALAAAIAIAAITIGRVQIIVGWSHLGLHAHLGLGKEFLLHLPTKIVASELLVVLALLILLALYALAVEAWQEVQLLLVRDGELVIRLVATYLNVVVIKATSDLQVYARSSLLCLVEELAAFGAPSNSLHDVLAEDMHATLWAGLAWCSTRAILGKHLVQVTDLIECQEEVVSILASESESIMPMALAQESLWRRKALSVEPTGNTGALTSQALTWSVFVRRLS